MNASEKFASVAHQGYGRTRLRFKSERGNKLFFDGLVPRLIALSNVVRVEARPLTGSVIVYHQGSWSELAERIEEAGLFAILDEEPVVNPFEALSRVSWPEIAKQLSKTGLFAIVDEDEVVNHLKASALRSGLPPPLVAAGGMAALAVWQVARGHALPQAITLLWYARALASPFVAILSKE